MPATRTISGLTLRALDSPSHLAWVEDERLQFVFTGTAWKVLTGVHQGIRDPYSYSFPSLFNAAAFCQTYIKVAS